MALEELDGLFADFAEADRATVKALLEKNPAAAAKLTQRETVYTAFVDGDTTKLATLTAPAAVTTTTTPAVDLADLDRRLDERMAKVYDDPRFDTAVERRAKVLAEEAIKASRASIIGAGAEVADQIYQIRSTHKTEFGTELDRSKFDPFFTENAAKYGHNLLLAYNAFVEADRTQKKIDDGIKAGLAAQQTRDVPGVSQPGAGTPAGMFIKSNPMNTGVGAARGDALDAAAAAFRSLSAQRVQ